MELVLVSRKVGSESNEIAAIPKLFDLLDINGKQDMLE